VGAARPETGGAGKCSGVNGSLYRRRFLTSVKLSPRQALRETNWFSIYVMELFKVAPKGPQPPASVRRGMEMALGPEFWQKAQILFVPDYKSGGGSFDVIGPAPVSNLWSVHLDRSAVMKTWPATSAAVQKPEPPPTRTKPKYGPEGDYDWEKCAIAVMLKCQQKGGPPARVARLMEYAREWFGPDHEPGESALRQHMNIIFHSLKTGKPP
jgi:hypothetical protein